MFGAACHVTWRGGWVGQAFTVKLPDADVAAAEAAGPSLPTRPIRPPFAAYALPTPSIRFLRVPHALYTRPVRSSYAPFARCGCVVSAYACPIRHPQY
eukprot:312609-Rhodomonas_salina.1